ncbi:hypothetical protein [Vibrio methylphosphonaticus]|uniref:hypothetical protein n=1 Tax=Vibrio methylphosphonaticus TaxID=2946866 RepID=UPI00202A178F|nr:hypothetical protein [Vibrio methylphosphonaticus]MCL9773762.1 hypothetical protein [Vibrio methylphosphonaticus]
MNAVSKIVLATTLSSSISLAFAQNNNGDDVIDPSNLTSVNTSAYLGFSNQGDVKVSGSIGYGLQNGQMAMGTLEASMDSEGKYNDSRLQYFHVFHFENPRLPSAAGSIDIIDNDNFTTAALGGVFMYNPDIENLTIFGRVGALAGQYDDDFITQMGETDNGVIGGMTAAYFSWKPGADGTYLMFSPEYTYMDGDVNTSLLKTSLTIGTPVSSDGKRWGQFKIEHTHGSMKSSLHTIDINDTSAWVFYKVFF